MNANRSKWVRQELHSAIMGSVKDHRAQIIPCMVDDTPLPALIPDRKGIDFSDARQGTIHKVFIAFGLISRDIGSFPAGFRGLSLR